MRCLQGGVGRPTVLSLLLGESGTRRHVLLTDHAFFPTCVPSVVIHGDGPERDWVPDDGDSDDPALDRLGCRA